MNRFYTESIESPELNRWIGITVLFQLLLLLAFLLGTKWLLVIMAATVVPFLLALRIDFWHYTFICSIFIFFSVRHQYQISDITAFLLVVMFFGSYLTSLNTKLSTSPIFLPIVFFLFTVGVSLIDAYDFYSGLVRYTRYIFLFLTYWVLHNVFVLERNIRSSTIWYLVLSLVAALSMILPIVLQTETRTFGIAGIPFNDLLVAANIMAFSFLIFSPSGSRLWTAVFFFLFVALILTQTRGAWLSFLLTAVFLIVFLYRKEKDFVRNLIKKKAVPLILITSLSVVAMISFAPGVQEILQERISQVSEPSTSGNVSSIFTRFLIWDTAVNVFLDNPVNGVGIDLFPQVSRNHYTIHPILYELFVEGLDPHLLVLTFLSETGIIGTVGFLVLVLSAFRIALRNYAISSKREDKSISFGLVGVIFFILVSSFYAGSWFYGQNSYEFMFFLALNTAFYRNHFGDA